MLDKVTLIIATKNRHVYLNRVLDYYSQTPLKIIVADATEHAYNTASLSQNVTYKHFPNIHYAIKLNEVAQTINTEYCLLCADDDFITLDGIEKSVEFLENHKDYSSAQGNYVAYYYVGGKLSFVPLYVSGIGLDINEHDPMDRAKRFFGSGIQMYYCVHRAGNFKEIFEIAAGKIRSLNLLEYHIGLTTLINGKHKVLPVFFGCRELLYNSAGKTAGIDELFTKPKYEAEFKIFLEVISKKLANSCNINYELAETSLKSMISLYLVSKGAQEFYKSRKRAKLRKKMIPAFIRHRLSKWIMLRNYEKTVRKNIAFGTTHPGFPFNSNEGNMELEQIKKLVLKHNIH